MSLDTMIDALTAQAHVELAGLRDTLRRHGIATAPTLELRRGQGMLTYCDLHDGHVYLSLPDPRDPVGALQLALFRSMLGCPDASELLALIELLLPRLIAHEVGHHLRHHHGCFGTDPWREEQIANLFAAALARRRETPARRARLLARLERALEALEARGADRRDAIDSYHSPLVALRADGTLSPAHARTLARRVPPFAPLPATLASHVPDLAARASRRESVRASFNREYVARMARYTHLQFGWLWVELREGEAPSLHELARTHLVPAPRALASSSNQEHRRPGGARLPSPHDAQAMVSPRPGGRAGAAAVDLHGLGCAAPPIPPLRQPLPGTCVRIPRAASSRPPDAHPGARPGVPSAQTTQSTRAASRATSGPCGVRIGRPQHVPLVRL